MQMDSQNVGDYLIYYGLGTVVVGCVIFVAGCIIEMKNK